MTIAFTDEAGNEKQIDEKWMLPCLDQFEKGSFVPVLWHPVRPQPKSIMKVPTLPRKILFYGKDAKQPSEKRELRRQRTAELTKIKDDFAPLFERIKKYEKAYFDPAIDRWKFEEARAEWAKTNSASK